MHAFQFVGRLHLLGLCVAGSNDVKNCLVLGADCVGPVAAVNSGSPFWLRQKAPSMIADRASAEFDTDTTSLMQQQSPHFAFAAGKRELPADPVESVRLSAEDGLSTEDSRGDASLLQCADKNKVNISQLAAANGSNNVVAHVVAHGGKSGGKLSKAEANVTGADTRGSAGRGIGANFSASASFAGVGGAQVSSSSLLGSTRYPDEHSRPAPTSLFSSSHTGSSKVTYSKREPDVAAPTFIAGRNKAAPAGHVLLETSFPGAATVTRCLAFFGLFGCFSAAGCSCATSRGVAGEKDSDKDKDTHAASSGDVDLERRDQTLWQRFFAFLQVLGPGMMLGLADSNAGDLLTAAQAGAKYKFLYIPWIAFLLYPLYVSTEVVTRIALFKNKPLFEMIWEDFGKTLGYCMLGMVAITCVGGLVMQIRTFVGLGSMFGIPGSVTCIIVSSVLMAVALTDSYRRMEVIGLALGSFEFAFIISAIASKPSGSELFGSLQDIGETLDANHATITGALIGAVVMPWMFFYQAAAVNKKGLTIKDLSHERADIALGSIATQTIMGGIALTFAVVAKEEELDLQTLDLNDMAQKLEIILPAGRVVFLMGMLGSAFIASLVLSLTVSWVAEEAVSTGSLGRCAQLLEVDHPNRTMHTVFATTLFVSSCIALTPVTLVGLIIFCDLVNSFFLLPILVLILISSSWRLQGDFRLTGVDRVMVTSTLLFVGLCGFTTCIFHSSDQEEDRSSSLQLLQRSARPWQDSTWNSFAQFVLVATPLFLTQLFIYDAKLRNIK